MAKNFLKNLTSLGKFRRQDYKGALEATFLALDKKVGNKAYALETGSTGCVVLITDGFIYCANAGDSRAILVKKGEERPQVIELSKDHKPTAYEEYTRIQMS